MLLQYPQQFYRQPYFHQLRLSIQQKKKCHFLMLHISSQNCATNIVQHLLKQVNKLNQNKAKDNVLYSIAKEQSIQTVRDIANDFAVIDMFQPDLLSLSNFNTLDITTCNKNVSSHTIRKTSKLKSPSKFIQRINNKKKTTVKRKKNTDRLNSYQTCSSWKNKQQQVIKLQETPNTLQETVDQYIIDNLRNRKNKLQKVQKEFKQNQRINNQQAQKYKIKQTPTFTTGFQGEIIPFKKKQPQYMSRNSTDRYKNLRTFVIPQFALHQKDKRQNVLTQRQRNQLNFAILGKYIQQNAHPLCQYDTSNLFDTLNIRHFNMNKSKQPTRIQALKQYKRMNTIGSFSLRKSQNKSDIQSFQKQNIFTKINKNVNRKNFQRLKTQIV